MRKAHKEEYVCPVCGWKTTSPYGIGGHMKKHAGGKEVKESSVGSVKCPICGIEMYIEIQNGECKAIKH